MQNSRCSHRAPFELEALKCRLGGLHEYWSTRSGMCSGAKKLGMARHPKEAAAGVNPFARSSNSRRKRCLCAGLWHIRIGEQVWHCARKSLIDRDGNFCHIAT